MRENNQIIASAHRRARKIFPRCVSKKDDCARNPLGPANERQTPAHEWKAFVQQL
jgi:hypothetical protein